MNLTQVINLPKSSLLNSPKNWVEDTALALPSGFTTANSIQLVVGDKLYLFGPSAIQICDLTTKTWLDASIAMTITHVNTATLFGEEDNQILITGIRYPNTYQNYLVVYQLNLDDLSLTKLYDSIFTDTSTYGTIQNNSKLSTYNKGVSIFIPEKEAVYFTMAEYNTTYWYYSSNSNYAAYVTCRNRLIKYDISLNTFTSYVLYDYATSSTGYPSSIASNYNTYKNNADSYIKQYGWYSDCALNDEGTLLYLANPYTTPGRIKVWSLETNAWLDDITSKIPYYATEAIDFNNQKLYFNSHVGVLYDIKTDELTRPYIPYLPVVPAKHCLNTWDNNIIYIHTNSTFLLPYVVTTDNTEGLPIAFKIYAGQEYCGEEELYIYDCLTQEEKLHITKEWQTATKDIEIKIGEYDAPKDYRLLISNIE